jgi:hypothetical protein
MTTDAKSESKRGLSKEVADRAWATFVREKAHSDDPLAIFRFSTALGGLDEKVKKAIVVRMRDAFDAALFSDEIANATEADTIHRFEAMGLPENVAMYLWREKDRVRIRDRFEGLGDMRDIRVGMAVEILKWACAPNTDEILEALAEFFDFRPEAIPSEVAKDMKSSKRAPDDCPPFMSESFLYPLLGKSDARTLLGRMRKLLRALGVTEMEVWKRVQKAKA